MAEAEPGPAPVFRMAEGGPALVREALLDLGWSELDRTSDPDGDFNLWWKNGRFKPSELEEARCHGARRINHFSKSNVITRKDSLLRAMRRMRSTHGAIYSFTPRGFLLPSEYTKFVKAFAAQERKALWICKPSDMSRGRQIFLVRDIGDLTYSHQSVIQEYVHPPLLIEGFKHDLRLYVLVTSCHPLKAYLYRDGLVRFSTEKYDGSEDADLDSLFSHLTNASINKKNPERDSRRSVMGAGAKWTLARFQSYLQHRRGADVAALWRRIEAVINLSLLPLVTAVPPNAGCFELFGFDIILDAALRPWVLEVNCSPSLGADCEEDHTVKRPLLRDMLKALDVPASMRAKEDKAKCADSRNRGRSRLYSGRPPPRSVIASEPTPDTPGAGEDASSNMSAEQGVGAAGKDTTSRVEGAPPTGPPPAPASEGERPAQGTDEKAARGGEVSGAQPAPRAPPPVVDAAARGAARGARSTQERRRGREPQRRAPNPAQRSASVGDARGAGREVRTDGGSTAQRRRGAVGHGAATRGAGHTTEWCRDARDLGGFRQVTEIMKAIVADVKQEFYPAGKPCAANGAAAREEAGHAESRTQTASQAPLGCKKPPRPGAGRASAPDRARQPAEARDGVSPEASRSASPMCRRPHSAQGSAVEAARMLRDGDCAGLR